MVYVLISVVFSVSVSVLLKLAAKKQWHIGFAIAGAYLVASVLAVIFLPVSVSRIISPAMLQGLPLLLALGVLLPCVFLLLARSVALSGVVKTDAAQRLSLLVTLLVAFVIYHEALTVIKLLGLGVGLLAIVLIVAKPSAALSQHHLKAYASLAGVFFGFAAIDLLFKQMALLQLASFADTLTACFILAFLVCFFYYSGQLKAWLKNSKSHLLALLLGACNFANIVFYIQAHRQLEHSPALVFSSMNIGVIVLASVIGVVFFREKLSRWNWLGVLLAIMALLILASA